MAYRSEKCEYCGGFTDLPPLHGCNRIASHAESRLSWRIVQAVEHHLNDRRGIGWSGISEEILFDIRNSLTDIVERVIVEEQNGRSS